MHMPDEKIETEPNGMIPNAGEQPEPAAATRRTTRGRKPRRYSDQLARRICLRVAMGWTLRDVSHRRWSPNYHSIIRWLLQHLEFQREYGMAINMRAIGHADEIVQLADAPADTREAIERHKLRIDARKWVASRLVRSKYGDRLDVGTDGGTLEQLVLAARAKPFEHLSDDQLDTQIALLESQRGKSEREVEMELAQRAQAAVDVTPRAADAAPSSQDEPGDAQPTWDHRQPPPPNTIAWRPSEPAPGRVRTNYEPFERE